MRPKHPSVAELCARYSQARVIVQSDKSFPIRGPLGNLTGMSRQLSHIDAIRQVVRAQ